ncbi:uncharacterized protein LOC116852024 [Odontomachus brunneus]|uniref:uncharacterized protein LOC116852024 n=1 Tax=Odontomachus brunneus TaxID=486640 RepID=UPI0013F1C5E5|nr:uncharacterized protein LOC116852024 [Odontomachus brunneus]
MGRSLRKAKQTVSTSLRLNAPQLSPERMSADLYKRISATRSLLLVVGLWPYHQSKFTQIQRLLIFSILSSFIAFQFTTFVTAECTTYFTIKLLSSILLFIACLFLDSSFWFHISNVKYLLEQIQYICYYLKDENEISIINKYASSAERNSIRIIRKTKFDVF